MMGDTTIEWAEKSWNPVTGCAPISEGCANCYAKKMASRLRGRYGYPQDDPFRVTLHSVKKFQEPWGWTKPSRVFVCSMGDLFHEDVPEYAIGGVIATMGMAPRHQYILLTKRPKRMREIVNALKGDGPLPGTWLGVTAENQAWADERIPILLDTPAAVRWVSVEPMLGPVDLRRWLSNLDWVVCGGETGSGRARYMAPEWAKSLYAQCEEAHVPFFFKHPGSAAHSPGVFNELLGVREYPHA